MDTQTLIPIELIDPNPYQPRQVEDPAAIAEIAASIKQNGLMQVPSARKVDGRYQLAFGHTRLAAFRLNNEPCMPLTIRELDDLQMFELGVAENIKRRDLNPIEQAEAIKRYMKDFNKNSVETGEFFSVSPEKVRSAVRLLDLPHDIQSGLADGTITQNSARRLLTIQRVAPQEIKNVTKELKDKSVDPDEVVANALKNSGNSFLMWPSWRGSAAMAGPNLWALNLPADKFPRAHLPEVTPGYADKIVGTNLNKDYNDRVVMMNRIRHFESGASLETMPGYALANKEKENWDRLEHLINPPACSACPFYAKVKGDHFCTFKDCYNRKAKAWQANILEQAFKTLGIPAYDHKTDGAFIALAVYNPNHVKIVKAKSADLRLKKGTSYHGFDDIPEGYVIVAVGKTAEKLTKAEEERGTNRAANDTNNYRLEQERLNKLRDANSKALYDFLWNVATCAFLPAFVGISNVEFIKTMADRFVGGVPAEEPGKKATKKERMEFYQRAILFQLLNEDLWDFKIDEKNNAVRRYAKLLQNQATTWGVKLPKNWIEQATQADKAITVTVETE